jgi:hypothetical protein
MDREVNRLANGTDAVIHGMIFCPFFPAKGEMAVMMATNRNGIHITIVPEVSGCVNMKAIM